MLYGSKLPADIKKLNRQLISHFGMDTASMRPMWRISWSDDQTEIRLTKYTPSGIELLHPQEFEMPKYSHVRERWVLERLEGLSELSKLEIKGVKTSYEIKWNFTGAHDQPVFPTFKACKFIIDTFHAALGKESLGPKYVDPYKGLKPDEIKAKKEKEIDGIVEELFGDESFLLGRTITGEAIAMPKQYGLIVKE